MRRLLSLVSFQLLAGLITFTSQTPKQKQTIAASGFQRTHRREPWLFNPGFSGVNARDPLSGSSRGAILITLDSFPPRLPHSHPPSTTTSMSNEKASVNSKHSEVEKGPSYQQMTGWRKVYYSPLTQIFHLGFILFMYAYPDCYSCHSDCCIGVQGCSMVSEATYNGLWLD